MRNVVALRIAVAAEVVGDLDVQGEFGIREALERDLEVFAHDAPRTLGADQIVARDALDLAGRIDGMRDDAGTVLFKAREVGRQAQVDAGMRLCYLERFLDDLDALALEHVRKARIAFEMAVIERRDRFVGGAIPIMKHRRDDAPRLKLSV